MEEIKFHEAKEKDLTSCLQMISEFYAIDQYPFDMVQSEANFREILHSEHLGKFWILMLDQEVIGYLILTYGYSFEYGGRDAFIDEFYLKESFRGKGYGTQILKELDNKALELKVNAIHLEVEKTNDRANELYKRSGFKDNNRALLTKVLSK